MILTRTPLRVSFFGGGTDYPEWFNTHGGAVLGMAINKYVYIGVKRMPPGQLVRYRIVYSKIDDVMEVEQIRHPAVRGCLQHLGIDTPLEIHYAGDLASGGGLGASSAFVVGLLHALRLQFFPDKLAALSPEVLAAEAIWVEQRVIGEAVGCQDQLFAAYGGVRFMEFLPQDDCIVHGELWDSARTEKMEGSLVLVYSGTMRMAHVMAAKQLVAMGKNEEDLIGLTKLANSGRTMLEGGDLSRMGLLLRPEWERKRRLHPEISNPDIDRLYEHGLSLGALGGKLCGAGGGGFLLFWVPPELRDHFKQHIGAPCVDFRVARIGTHVLVNEP